MDDQRAKELLARERARIEAQLETLASDREEDVDPEDAGSATEMVEEGRDAGLTEGLAEELAAIGRAEERLAAGKYGISIESGEPIPDGRLEIVPWAERTAQEEERRT
ncbi:MAG: hypothetical protein H0T15_07925 [Thermoleophilaceae bacterium]|nr:hypothetical protein [Thermoleophilaceae bacterium]